MSTVSLKQLLYPVFELIERVELLNQKSLQSVFISCVKIWIYQEMYLNFTYYSVLFLGYIFVWYLFLIFASVRYHDKGKMLYCFCKWKQFVAKVQFCSKKLIKAQLCWTNFKKFLNSFEKNLTRKFFFKLLPMFLFIWKCFN